MKILLLTQWYPPEPGVFLQELAQTLLAKGHDVTVLTGFPNYPSGNLYPGYRLRLYQREMLAGVPVIRVPLYLDHSLSSFKRVLNYASFALSSSILGFWLAPRPNVIFVYHPPLTMGLPAWILSRLWRIQFVYQVQDMWPETLIATGMIKSRHLLSMTGRFARWVYAKAYSILAISPGFRKNLIEKGVSAEKVRVISNWLENDVSERTGPDTKLARRLGLAGRFNIMFAGNIGEAQGLETVLEAAELLESLPEIQFVFIGDGIALPRLEKMAATKLISNVRFLGRFPHNAMPGLFALADVLLVHLKDDPLFRITIPHKILSYMGSGKPILAALAGDGADLVTAAGAGVSCPPGKPEDLAVAVRDFLKMSADERKAMGERGLQTVQTRFSREALIAKIEKVLTQASRSEC
ncbi:MAG: glycosyltransferase family 4 protein [Candidatus Aminicenantales bacterium]